MSKKSKRSNRKNRDKSWRHQLPKMPEFVRLPMCGAEGDESCTCPEIADSVLDAYRQSVSIFATDVSIICSDDAEDASFDVIPDDEGHVKVMARIITPDLKSARKLATRFVKMTGGDSGVKPLHTEHGSFCEGVVTFKPKDMPDMPSWAWGWGIHFTDENTLVEFLAS